MDPLSRVDAVLEERSPAYYRGFFDAERRRKVVNPEITAGQAVGGALFAALPISLGIYLVMRARGRMRGMGGGGGTPSGSFFDHFRQAMDRAMNPLPTRDFRAHVHGTTFADVIALPEAVEAVRPYVELLRNPSRLSRLGGRPPKGCLLTGPPGTGKTLLARAVAGEAGGAFFACTGADFIEVYAGSGPRRVRELFAAARASAPALIFIDEIDAVGARSGGGEGGQGRGGGGPLGLRGEENRTVNELLTALDGLHPSEGVAVLAATNNADALDPALRRAGRFDRQVVLPMPDPAARAALFAHFLGRIVVAPDDEAAPSRGRRGPPDAAPHGATAWWLSGLTPGATPAALAAIVNEAALRAAGAGRAAVHPALDFPPAVDAVRGGRRGGDPAGPGADRARRHAAAREAARALVAWGLPTQGDVLGLSLRPCGAGATDGAAWLGFTRQLAREAADPPTETALWTDLCVRLAGRLGEGALLGRPSVSAASKADAQDATRIAVEAILSFGLPSLPFLPPEAGRGGEEGRRRRGGGEGLSFEPQRFREGRAFQRHSEATQRRAEAEAARWIAAAGDFTARLLRRSPEALRSLFEALLARKELQRVEIEAILGPRPREAVVRARETRLAIAQCSAALHHPEIRRGDKV